MPNGLVCESHLNTRQPNIVDVGLLLKRLKIMGLPGDVIGLIEVWIRERFFYVSTNGSDSCVKVKWCVFHMHVTEGRLRN